MFVLRGVRHENTEMYGQSNKRSYDANLYTDETSIQINYNSW